MSKNKFNVILDSGAFTAWTHKRLVDIDAYIQCIKENLSKIEVAVALDVIPGRPGKMLTATDIEEAAQQTWKNYKYMLKKGIPFEKLMPVFHQGEAPKYLERMLKVKVPYIGISPANDKTASQRKVWLKNVCNPRLLDSDGNPVVRWHGFGVTSIDLLNDFHWHSVDSASWRLTGSVFGAITVPKNMARLKTIADWRSVSLPIADTTKPRKHAGNLGIDLTPSRRVNALLSPMKQLRVNEWVSQFGYTLEGLSLKTSEKMRNCYNAEFQYYVVKNIIKKDPREGKPLRLFLATLEGSVMHTIDDQLRKFYKNEELPKLNVLVAYNYLDKTLAKRVLDGIPKPKEQHEN